MAAFRYAQFCPVARACELLASRWTLLVVRDLFTGPLRFSDLQRSLAGISTSVLAERLAHLEAHGIVERRELPPPAGSTVYALTATGRALRPALTELLRWGLRFMEASRPDDHLEPRWVPLGLEAVARRGPTPAVAVELRIAAEPEPVVVRAVGGPEGTRLEPGPGPADAACAVAPRDALLLAAGVLDPDAAAVEGRLRRDGDPAALRRLPALFDVDPGNAD